VTAIATYVLLAGALSAVVGFIMQMIGRSVFSRFNAHDTKELAGIAGIRISLIFGIAVGLIFSSSHAYYSDAKKDVLEEVRLIGTLYFLTSDSNAFPEYRDIRKKLLRYAQASANDLDQPELADPSAKATSQLLVDICKDEAQGLEKSTSTAWLRAQVQNSCNKLIDLRGRKRVRMAVSSVEAPFWIFFVIAFCFLALLFGVFDRRPLNLVFSALFYFVVGATAILIFWMGNPYHGPGRIDSKPYMALIAQLGSLDKTQ
jgi:hypothetical protein